MSTKKKKPKNKKSSKDAPSYDYTLGSSYIKSDHERHLQQEIDALPVDDPDSIHFDERKYDRNLHITQSMDWIDYDASSELQLKYIKQSDEFEQYSMDNAPYEFTEIEPINPKYSSNAYDVKSQKPHIAQGQYASIHTHIPQQQKQNQSQSQQSITDDNQNQNENENYTDNDDEFHIKHPSEGGSAKSFIEYELKQQKDKYQEWRKYSDKDDNAYPPQLWNSALSEPYENKNLWWNKSSKYRYDMPHQALHGGVNSFDDETDIPLNAFWHKATVSPDSWLMIKNKYREGMRPGSQMWNTWAFRSDLERKTLKWWPETTKQWFVRTENDLLHSHEFRCKMLEHSCMDEYWRLGELRWNRKLWEPYIRIGTWVVAPILGGIMTYWWRSAVGHRTNKQFEAEFARWKKTAAVDQADEYYMFSWRDSLQKRRPPPIVAPAPSVEDTGRRSKKTMTYAVDKMLRGEHDPY